MIQHIPLKDATIYPIDNAFKIYDYGHLGNGISNGTVAVVNGRYPAKGWGFNEKSDELVYVIAGLGFLETPNENTELTEGSVAFIPKGQKIAWNGDNLKIFIPCIPAWSPEQHQLVTE